MVLCVLWEQPTHPYQVARLLKQRHKEDAAKLNYGSLYTVVASLEAGGAIEAIEVTREGNLPPRTTYRITDAGVAKMNGWLADLVANPKPEIPAFTTALSVLAALPRDKAADLLDQRAKALDVKLAALTEELDGASKTVPELFLIENSYQLAMARAEAAFTKQLAQSVRAGGIEGCDIWDAIHQTMVDGRPSPTAMAAAFERTGYDLSGGE
jgi:DNA-binding PadR family transcriptional regulator